MYLWAQGASWGGMCKHSEGGIGRLEQQAKHASHSGTEAVAWTQETGKSGMVEVTSIRLQR
jgi:hypothetical protein